MSRDEPMVEELNKGGPGPFGVPLAEVTGLNKIFYTGEREVHALKDVDLAVSRGEFVSLLGPSGCGKTTLLNILSGLLPKTSGSVTFKGEEHTSPRRELGMMFQSAVLLPWRNVEENVLLPAEILGLDRSAYKKCAYEMLDLVGLGGFEKQYPNQLSGGMAQRVALTRLLTMDPEVLLMDEPFGALDEFTREAMDNELLRIWAATQKTVVFVTHNISEAVFLSDRIAVMTPRPGQIADIITTKLPRPRTADMLHAKEFVDMVVRIRSILDVR